MRANTRARRSGLTPALAVLLFMAGCASVGQDGGGGSRGTSGVVAWEVSDIGRLVSADNRAFRWSYVITIRNTGDRAIQLDRVERALSTTNQNVTGGTPTSQPYTARIEARSAIRYAAAETWGWRPNMGASVRPVETLPDITSYRRFFGFFVGGGPIEIATQVRLDSSIGKVVQPPTVPRSLPPEKVLRPGDLLTIAGLWRGSYRPDDSLFDVPITVGILRNGMLEVAEGDPITQQYRWTGQVKDGRLDLSAERYHGTLTLYELPGKHMLVGSLVRSGDRAGTDTRVAIYLEATPGLTRQEQEAVQANIARAKAEAYQRLDQAESQAQSASIALPTATSPPGVSAASPTAPSTVDEVLTNEAILDMVKAGVDEAVILAKIATTPASFDIRTETLMNLKRAGVPDRVLAAMVEKQ
jgi:hypothetical protein